MYNYDDLLESYKHLGIAQGRVVYITGNFGRPGHYEKPGKNNLLNAHLAVLKQLLGEKGTIVVPTHSWTLCNTTTPFDYKQTPSETGPFTEYVRNQAGSVRQFHPFSSSTAYGYEAQEICFDTSRHVYGLESPFQRMVDRDALYVSVGQKMESSISLIHHIELMMGVPYRYSKEFEHTCIVNGKTIEEIFYLFVLRRDCDIERDHNEKIFKYYREAGEVNHQELGSSFIELLSMKDFVRKVSGLFAKDIYSWLRRPPKQRPYQQ